jgi:hypothetical protein
MIKLCPPAIIYLVFSLTQIIIDTIKGLYNTALFKVVVMVMITFLLNILCEGGLGVISWIIVFIPFILMTVIVSMLLYVFGLDAATGTLNYKCNNSTTKNATPANTQSNTSNITIKSPQSFFNDPYYYTYYTNPSKNYSNIPTANEINNYNNFPPLFRSTPEYESFSQ